MNEILKKRYYQKFNVGLVIRTDRTTRKHIIHTGFGNIKSFYSSNPQIFIGCYVVYDIVSDTEVEFVDFLANYKYIETRGACIYRHYHDNAMYHHNNTIEFYESQREDRTKLIKEVACNQQSGLKSIYANTPSGKYGYKYSIVDRIDISLNNLPHKVGEEGIININTIKPSQETKLLLNVLFPVQEPEAKLDDRFLKDAYNWAKQVVDKYDFEEALNSVRVGVTGYNHGVCHDHNGEYVSNKYFYLDYLHHNKVSWWSSSPDIPDTYLEKTIFPEVDIHLQHTDDRNPDEDWINPLYPNPDDWDKDALNIAEKIRSRAKDIYNRTDHIVSLVSEEIKRMIPNVSGYAIHRHHVQMAFNICWEYGLRPLESERIIDSQMAGAFASNSKQYDINERNSYDFFNQPELEYGKGRLVNINHEIIEQYTREREVKSKEIRENVFYDYLGLIGWRDFD